MIVIARSIDAQLRTRSTPPPPITYPWAFLRLPHNLSFDKCSFLYRRPSLSLRLNVI